MICGFTGSRTGMTPAQRAALRRVLIERRCVELHHGDAVGADAEAHELALLLWLRVVMHPPLDDRERAYCSGWAEIREPLPYLERNEAIVDEAELLVAAPDGPERTRSGTWYTVRAARRAGVPVVILWPDGRIEQ